MFVALGVGDSTGYGGEGGEGVMVTPSSGTAYGGEGAGYGSVGSAGGGASGEGVAGCVAGASVSGNAAEVQAASASKIKKAKRKSGGCLRFIAVSMRRLFNPLCGRIEGWYACKLNFTRLSELLNDSYG